VLFVNAPRRSSPPPPTTSSLTAIVDAALATTPVGSGGQGTGYVVRRSPTGREWFVKVPSRWDAATTQQRLVERRLIAHEVRIGEGLRVAGLTAMVVTSWLAVSSRGVPALVRLAGTPLDPQGLSAKAYEKVEDFLVRAEQAGWRVGDEIQLVVTAGALTLTDLADWKHVRSAEARSDLPRRLRELAHAAFGTDENTLLTLPEIVAHAVWLERKLAAGPLTADQVAGQYEDWFPAVAAREEAGLSVPAAFRSLLARAVASAPVANPRRRR
jgi:hypothetical protein